MPPEVQALGHPRDAKLEHPTSQWQPSPLGNSTKVWRGASPLASHAADANAPPPLRAEPLQIAMPPEAVCVVLCKIVHCH